MSVQSQCEKLLRSTHPTTEARLLKALSSEAEGIDYLLQTARERLSEEPQNALQRASFALKMGEIRQDSLAISAAWRIQAQARRVVGDHASAVTAFENASAFAAQVGDALLAAQAQIGRIDSLGWLGHIEEAIALARQLDAELHMLGAPQEAAKVQVNLGSVYYRRDQYTLALDCYERALEILAAGGDDVAVARVQANCANILTVVNRTDEAIALYEQARATFARNGALTLVATVDAAVGLLHFESGKYAIALATLGRARREFDQRGQVIETAKCDAEMAEAYRQMNLHPEALACFERAIDTFTRIPIDYEHARAEVGYAATLMAASRFEEALAVLERAQSLFNTQKNRLQQAHVRILRAVALQYSGNEQAAISEAHKAQIVFSQHRLRGWAAEAQFLGAEIALRENQDRTRTMRSVSRAAQENARGWLECRAERALARYYVRMGKPSVALRHLRKGVAALERARTLVAPEEMHVAFLRDKLGIYEDLVSILLERGGARNIAEALLFVEQSKSRLLWERIQTTLTKQTLEDTADAKTRERLAALRAEVSRGYHRLYTLHSGDPSRRILETEGDTDNLARMEQAYREALRDVELNTMSVGQGVSPLTRIVSIESVQRALKPDETLVEYYIVQDRLYAFVITPQKIVALRDIAGMESIHYSARRLRYHLQKAALAPMAGYRVDHQALSGIQDALREIYNALLRPLARNLTTEKLTIVPHGSLHGLPFHALMDGAEYAADRWEFVSVPSAALWYAGTQRSNAFEGRKIGEQSALLVGVADTRIHKVDVEIQRLQSIFREAIVLCQEKATVAAFFQNAAESRYIHLATHALYRADNPLFSGLRFTDGWLLARDLYEISLNCDLATLSACQTGVSLVRAGDEIFGLPRGFLAAGARSVIASLWLADDEATAVLMQQFYLLLRAGRSKASALRAAQQHVRAEYPHPYHWAAFTLIGERE